MIKYLFIVINSLAVFLYGLFSSDGGITLTGTFPSTLKAGQETTIEIKISKGSMNGFAKLQLELPEGLAPKESENKGANYTYNAGIAKWVWASLPPESDIIIKVKLISSDEAVGLKTIHAKFSFVENNAKQVVEMTPAEITITASEGAAKVAASSPVITETTTAAQPETTVAPSIAETVPAATTPATATIPAVTTPATTPTVAPETPVTTLTEKTTPVDTSPATSQNDTPTTTQTQAPVATETPTPVTIETTLPVTTETIASVPVIVETSTPEQTQPDKNKPAANTMASGNQGSSNAEPPGNIHVVRTLIKNNENEYLVKLRIKKGATKGFARYSDDLAEGLTIKALKTEGSSFSVGDGKLKFVWVNVPSKDELELEYLIIGSSGSPVVVNGEYSYLEDNQSKKYKVVPETLSLSSQMATNPASVRTDENGAEAKTASATSAMNETLSKKEGSVNYHVQIGAFTSSKVNATLLKKLYNLSEIINSEMQGGFSKFMVGTHGEYKEAHDHREVVKNNHGVKNAFVVAYNGSKRITVQEALMITNQKWFK